MKLSYAQVLASRKDPCIESKDLQIQLDTDAWSQLQQKQFILDGDNATREKVGKLLPKELIMKANLAIDKLKKDMKAVLVEDYNERPENTKFIAVRALKNGGVLLKMIDKEGTNWLRQKDILKAFK